MGRKRNILIVYYYDEHPPRMAIWDHLYSFRRYSSHNCYYLNLAVYEVTDYIASIPFDLVIFHTTFLGTRWNLDGFRQLVEKIDALKRLPAVKAALPQDEFIHTDVLCDFINDFGVDCVFTVAPSSEWSKIYHRVDFGKVRFLTVLTGYLDEKTLRRIKRLAGSTDKRDVDIGYRAWRAAAWLGRHGLLKVRIADVFQERAESEALNVDVSTRPEDTLFGDKWYEFLLRCKYTLGVEGGASVLDRDGTIKQRTEAYVALHPDASFEEIAKNCFPDLDGTLELMALSPRNLEACATRTCQVLVEGWYNGILVPDQHYIELKRDFSNLEQVLEEIKEDGRRSQLVERAYRDVVESGLYTYRSFVNFVTERALEEAEIRARSPHNALSTLLSYYRMYVYDVWAPLWLRLSRILERKLQVRRRARRVWSRMFSAGKA